jgi:hypothetical protein
MSIWCVGHSFVTSIVQVFDFWLTRKTPVWAKSLKSEQMRLQKSVNNKKCLFYYSKLFRNFKCPKMALRWAKISNSKYSYWMHNLEFESDADEFTENMSFQIYWNGVKNIQAAAYNGARTVVMYLDTTLNSNCRLCIQHKYFGSGLEL